MTKRWLGDNTTSRDLKDQWINNGYSIIRGAYDAEAIAAYNAIVARVRSEVDDGKDEYGYGDRIGQLHQKEPELLKLATNPDVLNFLRWAFADEPILFASLNFERGTQQDAHIDAIFFWPEPSYAMAGCWIALEDISSDAGPLFYVPRSHRWPFYHSEDVVRERPDLAAMRDAMRRGEIAPDQKGHVLGQMTNAWVEDLRSLEAEHRTERTPLSLKAGDVVFWHSLLAHGGSPRINPALTRRSVVFHYIGRNTKLFTSDQFMTYDQDELPLQEPQRVPLRNYEGLLDYMRYGNFVTHTPTGQHVIPVVDG